MAFLEWLQASALSTWVREGESVWAYPTILTLHTFGLGILVGLAAVVNLRLLGVGGRMPLAPLRPLFPIMWGGFWLNAVTGSMLFMADAPNRGTSLFFLAKMVFVALGVVSLVLIRRAMFDAPADQGARPPARGLAILSLAAWIAAITTGRLLAYV